MRFLCCGPQFYSRPLVSQYGGPFSVIMVAFWFPFKNKTKPGVRCEQPPGLRPAGPLGKEGVA